jgi:serine/threonine protein kinase/formylglycine-generating enzyme required for sulfatase activity
MYSSVETIWTRYAVNCKKITRTQLQTCLEEQGKLKAKGLEKTVSEILVEHGFLDRAVANKLMDLDSMISGYSMKEILGTGGLGIVYKAYSAKYSQDVAIKILSPEYTDNSIVLTRFLRETEISKTLDHPYIVKGLESGRVEDIYYLVLELIDGVDLGKYTDKFGPLPPERVLAVAVIVSNALYYSWSKGLTHRDIKPENIMLAKSGQLKVCDFGLAKLADANVAVTLTGTIVGSPHYISPEQVLGANLDYHSDIYSLGATLYFLITGHVMFEEKSMIAICNAHVNKTPQPPTKHIAMPRPLEEIILRMLQKKPDDRCKSPEEFMSFLKAKVQEFKQGKDGKAGLDAKDRKETTPPEANNDKHLIEVLESQQVHDSDLQPERIDTAVREILERDGEDQDRQTILKKALVVAPEGADKKLLCEQLQQSGLKVCACHNGEEGLTSYDRETPDLIIASTCLQGKMNVWDFLSGVKQRQTANQRVHIVLLEDKANLKDRMCAMLLGVKHNLVKPVTVKAIIETMEYATKALYTETNKLVLPKLKGNLSLMSLSELLQTLHASRKTGTLIVRGCEHEGRIHLAQSKVYHAELGKLSPKAALFEMLSWQNASFVFQELPVMTQKCTLNVDIMEISLNGRLLLGEIDKMKALFGSEQQKDFALIRLALLEEMTEPQNIIEMFNTFAKELPKGNKQSFLSFLRERNVIDAEIQSHLHTLYDDRQQARSAPSHIDTMLLTKGGHIIPKEQKNKSEKEASKTGGSTVIGAKGKIEDTILQQLLLSLNVVNMSQMSECISVQVDLQLHGTPKNLADIIVEQGYVDNHYIKNLMYFRNEDGSSLIPSYEIVDMIGEGGLAAVYLGRNTNTNQTVAIKIFAPTVSDTSSTIARFMREAEAAKKLDHPNIVKANDFGSIHGIYYLVMEYVPGLSLSQIISKMGRLEEQKALVILEQLAGALTYAWQQNIIHRDIKPGNILLDGEVLKICDLGLAKVLESGIELTQEGNILGTPQFMSPEQFQPEKQLDFRTDVYSLGVTFYVMLTGCLPFTATTKIGLAQAHLMQQPPPLEKFKVFASKATKLLLRKMLCKDREKRCKEKTELLEDIHRVRQGKFPKNTGFTSLLPGGAQLARIAAFFCVVVAVAAAALFVVLRPNPVEKLKSEVSLLIAGKKYEVAVEKILHAKLEPEEETRLLGMVQDAQSKGIKILDIVPRDGSQVYDEQAKLIGTFQCEDFDHLLVNKRRFDASASGDVWHFEALLPLTAGSNSFDIQITCRSGYRKQYTHTIWQLELDKTPPAVTLLEPTGVEAGKTKEFLNDTIILKGYAIDNKKVQTIAINDKAVPILAADNKASFEVAVYLKEGTQKITIVASDERNNQGSYSFDAYLKPKGWLGEEIADGLVKDKTAGDYLYTKDESIMVYVPEGEFYYGATKEEAKKVHLSGYYIDKFEVTWKQYLAFCKNSSRPLPKKPKWEVKATHPAVQMTYNEISDYARWAGKSVPTVAQWMKAARGGVYIPDLKASVQPIPIVRNTNPFRLYPWGDELPNALLNNEKVYRCNYCADNSFVGQGADGFMYTASAGEFASWNSPYGCADMAGNVFEVCKDWYDANYMPVDGEIDPQGPGSPTQYYAKMGGGFYSLEKKCTIGARTEFSPDNGDSQTGFRLVKLLKK